jgi:cyclophilin family peptidyl-prolyl cis-trans isomerase
MAPMRASLIATLIGLVAPIAAAAQTPQQAVLETSAGTIVWDLLADKAPNHVALFIKTAREGGLDGTSFHRMVRYGVVQGGDPVTKDPSARDKYGSGGLNQLKTEITDEKLTKGAVAAVQVPGKPDSAGTQFFMCINAQPSLDGKYTVFARIVEGILVAQKISETPVDANGLATERVIVTKVTIRDKPAETPEPFSTEPVADLARYRAILETSMARSRCRSRPRRRPTTSATSSGWLSQASTTG